MILPLQNRHAAVLVAVALLLWRGSDVSAQGLEEWRPIATANARIRLEYRLLIDGEFVADGLRISGVDPRGPGAGLRRPDRRGMARMQAGDILLAIDGREVKSAEQYYAALNASQPRNGKVTIRLRDIRTGQVSDWQAEAAAYRFAEAPMTTPMGRATGIKVIMVGLTKDPKIGPSVGIDLRNFRDMVQRVPGLLPEQLVELRDDQAHGDRLMEALDRLTVAPTESLVCYISAHGQFRPGAPPADLTRGHELVFENGRLARKQLIEKLQSKKARLNVLITDTCNAAAAAPAPIPRSWSAGDNGAMAILFLDHTGTLDVNGASQGQFAWSTDAGQIGGYFTHSMCQCAEPASFAAGPDATWTNMMKISSEKTSSFFKSQQNLIRNSLGETELLQYQQFLNQADQRPQVFLNSTRRVNNGGP